MGFQNGGGRGLATMNTRDEEVVNVQIQKPYRVQYFPSKTHEEI
jgi:hypothetical protein